MLSLRIVSVAVIAVAALSVAGCSADSPAPTPEKTATALLNPDLAPQVLATVDETSATAEATRLADALAADIDPSTVVGVTDQSQLVPADDDIAPYYVAYRTYELAPSVDALTLAETLGAVLGKSGWRQHGVSDEDGLRIIALAGGTDAQPWFIFIQGDVTIDGQPALSIQLASPDL